MKRWNSADMVDIGRIEKGFHFLGIHYPGTQTPDNTNMVQAIDKSAIQVDVAHYMASLSGWEADIATKHQTPEASHIVPHPRTLRKAREQVKAMVNSGVSPQDQKLFASMYSVVGKSVATLAVSGTIRMVFTSLLGF